ncbi:DUF2179 domain-containing protein [Serpentinicella sp. ANB-PHB4]|uniref:DUF2179 domain-containing protein n=1 Tax=Serpentinicella sp. ANB-PHB4 TaxID=3074076 RepID=UPI00285C20AE|nr:DUF2179 domain-containing protein [Serpentinicella sp. ANB-PHB4]MDR5658625.1 DUF2179 domain-containing protein [Serpentinicella sp. ANB-PHB4]
MELMFGYLFIFFARLTDVSMATVRMIMVVKGKRLEAALIGFFEVIVYILAIGQVLSGLDNPVNVLVYALGFATGNYLGVYLEDKLALGNNIIQIITHHNPQPIVDRFREDGFGVTVMEGYGRDGIHHLLYITISRKHIKKVYQILDQFDSKAFITITDARSIRGGYFNPIKRK